MCLVSSVCLSFAGEIHSAWIRFYGDAVNVRRSNKAVTKPHKKRGNRIFPSGDKSKLNWNFKTPALIKQLLSLGLATMLLLSVSEPRGPIWAAAQQSWRKSGRHGGH